MIPLLAARPEYPFYSPSRQAVVPSRGRRHSAQVRMPSGRRVPLRGRHAGEVTASHINSPSRAIMPLRKSSNPGTPFHSSARLFLSPRGLGTPSRA